MIDGRRTARFDLELDIRTGDGRVGMVALGETSQAGNAIYGFGIFGAWVYFWMQADGFWQHVLALLEKPIGVVEDVVEVQRVRLA